MQAHTGIFRLWNSLVDSELIVLLIKRDRFFITIIKLNILVKPFHLRSYFVCSQDRGSSRIWCTDTADALEAISVVNDGQKLTSRNKQLGKKLNKKHPDVMSFQRCSSNTTSVCREWSGDEGKPEQERYTVGKWRWLIGAPNEDRAGTIRMPRPP